MFNKRDNFRRRSGRGDFKREKPEFDQKVLDIRRVTRVVAGGKRFRFRTTVILGDHKGRVGLGIGNGIEKSGSIEKAVRAARKNLITVPMKGNTIPHEIIGKYGSSVVLLKPAGEGKGIVAGGPVRIVVSLAGIANITAKILGTTTNKLNNARATIEALKKLKGAKDKK